QRLTPLAVLHILGDNALGLRRREPDHRRDRRRHRCRGGRRVRRTPPVEAVMELARGTVRDRPWGQTLGALGARGLSGQLTLTADGKQFCIAFRNGAIVGATSPLATDAVVRVALTGVMISSSQAAGISRRIASAPGPD